VTLGGRPYTRSDPTLCTCTALSEARVLGNETDVGLWVATTACEPGKLDTAAGGPGPKRRAVSRRIEDDDWVAQRADEIDGQAEAAYVAHFEEWDWGLRVLPPEAWPRRQWVEAVEP
jgi:hypothetical protein